MIHHINKLKKKKKETHLIISICAKKEFDKIQHPFIMKTLSNLSIEGTFLNTITAIYDKLMASILLNGEKFESIPTEIQCQTGMPTLIVAIQYNTGSFSQSH
uniref:Uncharacterized protein n=1 Tax=Oryctolagus cuniculus TaxID=9986 RepID=A0A5F9D675_RABIT